MNYLFGRKSAAKAAVEDDPEEAGVETEKSFDPDTAGGVASEKSALASCDVTSMCCALFL